MEYAKGIQEPEIDLDETELMVRSGWVARRCQAEIRHDVQAVRRAVIAGHLPKSVVERLQNAAHPYAESQDGDVQTSI